MADPARAPENMLDVALTYLGDEWSVFPVCVPVVGHPDHCMQHGRCKHPGKTPLIKWGIYQDRQPTRHEVEQWWRHRYEGANIGLATGATSDVVVIDLDGEIATAEALRRGYDPGPWVSTGRVGGKHLYFRYREDAPTIFSKVGGIDFRGHGGFVLLPPSLHYSGARYSWGDPYVRGEPLPDLPRWVDELAATTESGVARGAIDFGTLVTDGIPQGQRDQELFRAAAKLRGADVPYELAVGLIQKAASACQPPFDPDEARAKVDSAYSRYAPNPIEPTRLFAEPAAGVEHAEHVQRWRTLGELVRSAPETDGVIVEGLLWRSRTHWVYSSPGAGKTLFLLALLMHVADPSKTDFLGYKLEHGPVLLIEEDSPDSVISDYVQMIADIYGFDLDAIPFWLNVLRGTKITDNNGLTEVRSLIADAPEKPLVFALDACERIVPSDRFTSKELEPLSQLFAMNVNAGITNVIIDHTRKPQGTSSEHVEPLDMLYGGRAKSAISDVMMYFSGAIKNQAFVSFPKFRGEEPIGFSVSFDGASGFTIKQGKPKLSENERKIMELLNNSFGRDRSKVDIIEAVGFGEKTVQRALKRLVDIGWVERLGTTNDIRFKSSTNARGVFG